MLTSGKMKLEKINTWLGKKMFKNKSMDEASREWLTDALNRYEKNVLSTVGSITNEEALPKTKEELIARKEELEKEEDKTEETDKEIADINEQLKEPVIENREVKPKSQLQEQIDSLEVERAQKLAEIEENKIKVVINLESPKISTIFASNPRIKEIEDEIAELEKQKSNITKPKLTLDFIDAKTLVNSGTPIENKTTQDKIKERLKKLKDLINCL
jgi:hypothetical protein